MVWQQVVLGSEESGIDNVRRAENILLDKMAELVINYKGGNSYELASNEEFKSRVYDLIDALEEFNVEPGEEQ